MRLQTTPRIRELALDIAKDRRPPVIDFDEYRTFTPLDLEELQDALAMLAPSTKLTVQSRPG